MKEKYQRRLRNVLISLTIICLTPLAEKGRMLSGAHYANAFSGKDIVCAIDLGNDMYGGHGLETGLNYELIRKFAQDNHCNVKIVIAGKKESYLDSLMAGKVDILVTHDMDSLSENGIDALRQIHECSIWATKGSEENEIHQLNSWLSHITSSKEYMDMKTKFDGLHNPHRRAEAGVTSTYLSPYDALFKKHAAELGWDWRMLAAVVYQESRFSIGSRSYRGATGLMQVMPQTGKYYGVTDLVDPEQNIMAGTSHLKRLQSLMKKSGIENEELVKFTLAAYNAGEGRIADCRNFAASRQLDNTCWNEIVNIIPLMREDSILKEESVKHGKFQGFETIAYVDSIMSLYNAFCTICPV